MKFKLLATLFLSLGFALFVSTAPASAATTAEWINAGTIRVTSDDGGVSNGDYVDSNPGDPERNFTRLDNSCIDEINLDSDTAGSLIAKTNTRTERNVDCTTSATISITISGTPSTEPAKCYDADNLYEEFDCPPTGSFSSTGRSNFGELEDGRCYTRRQVSSGTNSSADTIYFQYSSVECSSIAALQQQAEEQAAEQATEEADREDLAPACLDTRNGLNEWMDSCPSVPGTVYENGRCYEISEFAAGQGGGTRIRANPTLCVDAEAIAGEAAPRSGSIADDDSCEGAGDDNAFGFVVCPLLRQANNAFSRLDKEIVEALDFEEAYYNNDSVREAWARVRNIAYILLIPIMLVMVISTALGFSFVDAYTVKRALPRMFAAIIFMALSFDVAIIFIEVVNAVGQGIAGIIAQPFGGLNQLTLQAIFTPQEFTGGIGVGVLAGLGAWAALGSEIIGILLSFLGVMVLALLAVFVLLSFRELLLVFLLIMGPFAILSWIFPGNDKLWKLWYGSFTKLLYLFPIIMALLATGRAFASIIQDNPAADGFVITLLKVTAFVGPYFFIPKAFALAGGAFSNIAGMANDRGKGVFDRQRKKRAQKAAQGLQTTKDGSRTGVGSRFSNRVGMGVASGAKGRYGFGKKGQSAMARVSDEATARTAKENGRLQQLALHDDDGAAVMALSGGTQAGAKEASEQLMDQWQKDEAKKAAADPAYVAKTDDELEVRREAALKSAQSVGINKRNSQAGFQLMMQNKARAINAGDSEDLIGKGLDRLHRTNAVARAQAGGEVGYFARGAGRADLGGPKTMTGINKAGLYQLAGGETKAIEAWGNDVMASGSSKRKATHLAELRSMQPNTTGGNQVEVNRQIAQLESDTALQTQMRDPSGDIDPNTGVQKQVYERFDHDRASVDADYSARWAGASRGDVRMRDETMAERAKTLARAYEPVDPNRVD